MADKEKEKRKRPISKNTGAGISATQIRDAVREELKVNLSRQQTLDTYINRLQDADLKVTEFVQSITRETTRAYRTTVGLYVISYIAATALLLGGVATALYDTYSNAQSTQSITISPISIILLLIGVISMLVLQSRNPVKTLRYMVDNLVKLNVIFAGYVRQIHQVDVVFEELVSSGKEISPQTAEQLLCNLQDAMTEAMNAISAISSDLLS